MSKIKENWEFYGKNNPYFAVVTLDKYKEENLSEDAKEDFFQTGEEHTKRVWNEIETHFTQNFKPKKALDFGCGVGRLLVPLAARCENVFGVDISNEMLEEAQGNCQKRGLENTQFFQTDNFLSEVEDKFDLIHSFIVFQHIKPSVSEKIIQKMLNSLEEDGIGVLHLTYSNPANKIQALRFKAYRDIPFLYRLRNLLKGAGKEPLIPMYIYDLNKIFNILQENNCHKVFLRFSFHGFNGVVIFFQKKKEELY